MLVAAASAFATGAGPRPLPGVPLPPGGVPGTALPQFGPPPAWCWVEVRLFDSLRTGPIDFCRKNLRYRPGALECYRIVDNVCASLMNTGQWATGRTPVTRSVLPCPRGPQPPVCRQLDIE
jgi:hypothetical protein